MLAKPFNLFVCCIEIYITLKISLETKGKSGVVGINFSRKKCRHDDYGINRYFLFFERVYNRQGFIDDLPVMHIF